VAQREVVGIIGVSGGGKTTLLPTIGGPPRSNTPRSNTRCRFLGG
jgi:ABC-type lipoprotein export system ATPase subunit